MSGDLKRCFKCLIEKPLDAFYRHSRMADGRLNKCMECTKADVAKNRQDNLERIRAYDRMRGSMPHRLAARREYGKTEAGRASHKRSLKASALKFPEKAVARAAISNGIRDGKVIPWPVCAIPECDEKPQAHHPDYSRPLDVVWLCEEHHRRAHAIAKAF